jgi:hypothetical protein
MMRRCQARAFLSLSILLWLILAAASETLAKPSGNRNGGEPPSEYVPMALEAESYFFRVPDETSCLGEDDELEWLAVGSLAPGESFSFQPRVPGCNGHAAAITVVAEWQSGNLELSAVVPDIDYSSWDAGQVGRLVQAPVVGHTAQLCMFPAFTGDGIGYTITLTNHSAQGVHGIRLHGRNENDWSVFYYPRCLNADADGDGWNDSLEHSMANLVYPNGYIDGVLQPDLLWGSNYLRSKAQTTWSGDEIDSYPPDFNDDGRLDALDREILEGQLGQGNGIPLQEISPNPGDEWFHNNTRPWRRYDLDGDGFVGAEDLEIFGQSASAPVPMQEDVVVPTARITEPAENGTVARGQYARIRSHAWDNAAITAVDYLVDGRTVCTVSDPLPTFGFDSPLYACWWDVPRRARSYRIEVRVTDAAGNVGHSAPIIVHAE